jgi:hypothetical protein
MTEKRVFAPGDVLSYSSGSEYRDPYGFRIAGRGGNLLGALKARWPHLVESFRDRMPIIINAYPAFIGTFDFGVTVDSYLSYTTASRALHLAHAEKLPVMLLGQPLFVAHLLNQHIAQGHPVPDAILLGMGGYPAPRSLEVFLEGLGKKVDCAVTFFYGYGVAEVDAAVLLAHRRNEANELVYELRGPDVEVTFEGDNLFLAVEKNGTKAPPFKTGDQARLTPDGYVISNQERMHKDVTKILESWSVDDWERRTGYLHYGMVFKVQLRKGAVAKQPYEVEFYEYAKELGHSWLFKPQWKLIGGHVILRRTLI